MKQLLNWVSGLYSYPNLSSTLKSEWSLFKKKKKSILMSYVCLKPIHGSWLPFEAVWSGHTRPFYSLSLSTPLLPLLPHPERLEPRTTGRSTHTLDSLPFLSLTCSLSWPECSSWFFVWLKAFSLFNALQYYLLHEATPQCFQDTEHFMAIL